MPSMLSAHVVPEHGSDFTAEITNLSTGSCFVRTERPLTFRQAVTVRFGDISLDGEVAFVCRDPAGAVLSFRASEEAIRAIEDRMDEVPILFGAPGASSAWDEPTTYEAHLGAEKLRIEPDPEDPTNTEAKAIEVEDEDDEVASEVQQAWVRASFPPRFTTEVVSNEAILAARSAALAGRAEPDTSDVEATVLPELSLATGASAELEVPVNLRTRALVGEVERVPDTETDPALDAQVPELDDDTQAGEMPE